VVSSNILHTRSTADKVIKWLKHVKNNGTKCVTNALAVLLNLFFSLFCLCVVILQACWIHLPALPLPPEPPEN
jgi:hypothetical protein